MRRPRRHHVGLAVLALVAAGIAGAVLAVELQGPAKEAVKGIERQAREVEAALGFGSPRQVHTTPALPKLTPAERSRLTEDPRDEEPLPPTPRANAEPVVSSNYPATRLASAPKAGTANFRLLRDASVDKGHADFVAEPDVASKGDRILETWNWGAAFSSTGGRKFTFVDPDTAFPRAYDGFCCDQVVRYVPGEDLWVWLLQYEEDSTGANIERLEVARGDAAFDLHHFAPIDIKPTDLNAAWTGMRFDYPNIDTTSANLFLAVNVYRANPAPSESGFAATVVIRIPFSSIDAGTLGGLRWFQMPLFSAVLSRGAANTMYIGAHVNTSKFRIFRWQDGSDSYDSFDFSHRAYREDVQTDFHCVRSGDPASADWCERSDDRPSSGWVADGVIGFTWNAQQDPAHGFRFPYVVALQVDEATMTLKEQDVLWSPRVAYQYAKFAPGPGGLAGIVLEGGGADNETCGVLMGAPSQTWTGYVLARSDHRPGAPKAGDYLGLAADPTGSTWSGSCSTINGGSTQSNVLVHYFSFDAGS